MSSMPPGSEWNSSPPLEAIEAAAALWLSLRDRGLSAAETTEFVAWLEHDPRHAAVFAELERTWKELDALAAPVETSATHRHSSATLRSRSRRWKSLGLGVVAAVLMVAAILTLRMPRPAAETEIGGLLNLDLPDGSVVQLNTDTAIATNCSAAARRVRVLRGEAYFSVMKDPARPFIVSVGRVAVHAVGTEFNVHSDGTKVEVLVTEGRVRLDDSIRGESLLAASAESEGPPLLVAGERAIVDFQATHIAGAANGLASVTKLTAPEVQRKLAWQERRLAFDGVPLAEVAKEFNRYNRRQLVIVDQQLSEKRFSGTFRSDGMESFIRLLETDFGVTVVRDASSVRLQLAK